MTKLFDEKNIPFCFVFLREYGSKLERPIDTKYYETIAPVYIPSESLYSNHERWMDGSHLNDRVRKFVPNGSQTKSLIIFRNASGSNKPGLFSTKTGK